MKFAVVCASGLGDALITSIASHHLRMQGHTVTTFSRHLPGLGRWLEEGNYALPGENWDEILHSFDRVLLQHDNTESAHHIVGLRKFGLPVYVFYTNYRFSKHGALLSSFDVPFNEEQTMVRNTCRALEILFGGPVSKKNCLTPPQELIHRKHRKRVWIHPTSGSIERNWPQNKYMYLARRLEDLGLEPIVASCELPTLEDLASSIYESGMFIGNDSGPGHLASYLSIPHLILASGLPRAHIKRWRPDWLQGELLLAPRWTPKKYWKQFITTEMVLNSFKSLIELKRSFCL